MPIPNVTRPCDTLVNLFPVSSSHSRDFIRENKQLVRDKSKQQHQTNYTASQLATQARKNGLQCNSGMGSTRNIGATENSEKNPQRENIRAYNWHPKPMVQSGEKVRQKTPPKVANQRRTAKPKVPSVRTKSVAIQTDDIHDELYLYSALKKCASTAFKNALRTKFLQKDEENQNGQQNLPLENEKHPAEGGRNPESRTQNSTDQVQALEKASPHKTNQHKNSFQKAYDKPRLESPRNTHSTLSEEHSHAPSAEVNDNFNVMSLPPEMKSICKIGTCTNCPEGYHLLTENEREHIKSKLMERERLFIKQLNSFPFAIETLRVRQCKTKIERELSTIEQNLRKLTKRKVYAKISE